MMARADKVGVNLLVSKSPVKQSCKSSQPPSPPPLADLIVLVLAVPVEIEGQMTAEEALAIFNVTHRSPKWLLAQVHPDKHPHHTSQAEARGPYGKIG